jgi:uncharacterized lipoprotein YmbA
MISLSKRIMVLIAVICLPTLIGCVNIGKGTVDPTLFYLLSAPGWEDRQEQTGQEDGLVIGIGPVSIPGYLKRHQIVTRNTDNEIRLAHFHRWGEHLEDGIPRVIAENISSQMPDDWVVVYPWRKDVRPDFRVSLEIYRFDAVFEGNAVLNVQWVLLGPEKKDVLMKRQGDYTRPVGGESYGDMVTAESGLMEDLSRDIVAAIGGLAE